MTVYIAGPPHVNLYTFPSAGNMASGWEGGMESMSEYYPFRSDITAKRYSPGGYITGDGLSDSRSITVAGIIKGPSKREVTNYIDEMRNACCVGNYNYQYRYLKLTQYPRQFYYIAGVQSFIVDWITDIAAEITVVFNITNPFRYDVDKTAIPTAGASGMNRVLNSGNDYTATVDITIPSSVAFIQLPGILILKYAGGMDSLNIRNLSARRPDYSNPGMNLSGLQMTDNTTGDGTNWEDVYRSLYIDSHAGTIELCASSYYGVIGKKINYISKLGGGDFMWLQPGTNTIQIIASPINAGEQIGIRTFTNTRFRYL